MTTYDPDSVRRYFDVLGEGEWDRLERDLRGQISYLVHRRFLLEHVAPGRRALDVGCGPGRFALDLVRAGAGVTLVELSRVQLQLAESRLRGAGFEPDASHEGDICDLGSFIDGPFDLVVAYGGVLSYTYDRHGLALDQLVECTTPGGHLALSVMPLGGTMRLIPPLDAVGFLADWERHMSWDPASPRPPFVLTVPGSSEWHQPI
ncbi:MAG: class I SAM-dependent methyltransferase, partial [Tepidiformaceae bacterium]